jgi:hypothetical protein
MMCTWVYVCARLCVGVVYVAYLYEPVDIDSNHDAMLRIRVRSR